MITLELEKKTFFQISFDFIFLTALDTRKNNFYSVMYYV